MSGTTRFTNQRLKKGLLVAVRKSFTFMFFQIITKDFKRYKIVPSNL